MTILRLSNLPPLVRDLVANEIRAPERITWMAQPRAGRLARQTIPIVLFASFWTAFSCYWLVGALGAVTQGPTGYERLFPLFGLPFLLIGLGMLSSPLWALRRARRTVYLVTDRRIVIIEGGPRGARIRALEPAQIARLERRQRPDGSGDLLVFCLGQTPDRTQLGFYGVPDIRRVEELVLALIKHHAVPSSTQGAG